MPKTDINPEITVSRLTEYTDEIAAGIGALLPQVWDGYSGKPMAKEALEYIINSTDREQIIATRLGQVVGIATVTIHVTPSGTEGWLNDFMVSPDPAVRGHGVGRMIYDDILDWCSERGITLAFTSKDPEVHPIYAALGATPDYVTTRFSAVPHKQSNK